MPADGVMVIELLVPSLEMPPTSVQFVMVKSEFWTKLQPLNKLGQEILNVLPDGFTVNAEIGAELPGFARRPRKRMLPD